MKRKLKVPVSIPKINFRRFSEKGKAKETVGQAPGTLIYTGSKNQAKVNVEIFSYNESEIEVKASESFEKVEPTYQPERINWINVSGLHNVELIERIGKKFDLHSLLLEDVLHVDQRPKTEDFGDYLFFTIKMFHKNAEKETEFEHVSFVLGKNLIICFQENPEDIFDLIRERLKSSFGKIRLKKADYLFYRFIDTIIDHYFVVLDQIAEKIEDLEDEVMDKPSTNTLQKLQMVRKELIYLRRSIFPIRESINAILRSETKLLNKETERFFSDVYDHTIQVIESMETYRDLLSGIMDLYMNTASNRMNEIMKVLTIMSTIFIPMTFIAGIYGMNFEHMPELSYRWAYPAAWCLMIGVAIFMLFYFKRKKWL
ncbi:MAG: magnesium/cobalt transporter CorA [Vicingaceae bacterium]